MKKGRLEVWIVKTNCEVKHVALTASQAEAFARRYNELVPAHGERVRIERKFAYYEDR